jgi:hypothetical protein
MPTKRPSAALLVAASLLFAPDMVRARYRIDTFAGRGYGDGAPAIAAAVNLLGDPPGAVDAITDSAGNVLFTDRANHRVRRVDAATGIITTVAGNGAPGSAGDGGHAIHAQLHDPVALALDAAGNLYIAERLGHRVRRVDVATGLILTVVGTGRQTGSIDGPGGDPRDDLGDGGSAALATLSEPAALAADPAGGLFISDYRNRRIRRVDAAGTITTYAGTGSSARSTADGTAATSTVIGDAGGLVLDAAGNLYYADYGFARVRRFAATPATHPVTTVAGSSPGTHAGDGGPATSAKLLLPFRIALVPAGCGAPVGPPCTLYIGDSGNHCIRKVDAGGTITTVVNGPTPVAGNTGDGGDALAARLDTPGALRGPGDTIVIVDSARRTNRVRLYDPAAGTIRAFAGDGQGQYGGDGGPATRATLNRPTGLAVDAAGNVYIADHENARVRRVDASRTMRAFAGTGERGGLGDGGLAGAAQLDMPTGVVETAAGDLLITDPGTHTVRRVDGAGIITAFAGLTDTPGGTGDGGPAVGARLDTPLRTAVDAAGNVYIADFNNHRIRRVDAVSGVITTVAGTGAAGDDGDDGPATAARLRSPASLVVGADGALYVSDFGNHRLRVVEPDGTIRALAGTGVLTGSLDGPGGDPRDDLGDGGAAGSATFADPTGLAFDVDGALLIADQGNNVVRRMAPVGGGQPGPTSIITTIIGTGVPAYAGDGGDALAASLNRPTEVLPLAGGVLLIADRGNQRVRVATPVTDLCDVGCDDGDPCTVDTCDPSSGCAHGERADGDADGTCDVLDNCPTTPNPTQADADADGIGDACPGSTPCLTCGAQGPCVRGDATCIAGGGPARTDCLVETVIAGARGSASLTCTDGDPACDGDPAPGVCRFTLAWCFNNMDPRLACTASGLRRVSLRASRLPAAPRRAFLTAAMAAVAASAGGGVTPKAAGLRFSPPWSDTNRCTTSITVDVALRTKRGGTRPGRAVVRTVGSAGRGVRDSDRLRLVCTPGS